MIVLYKVESCSSCKKLIQALLASGLIVDEIITVEDVEQAAHYKISSFPTVIKYDNNNQEVERVVGLAPLSRLKQLWW